MFTLLACTDFDVKLQPTDPPVFDTGEAPDTDTDLPIEACDGEDNDGDGAVDEGFDADGNGRADCFDVECPPLVLGPAAAVDVVSVCDGSVVTEAADPWDAVVEWHYAIAAYAVYTNPAVGNLDDDNGDGIIDDADTPDIAFLVGDSDELVVVSGDGSHELFTAHGFAEGGAAAIADVDADGDNEIVVSTTAQTVVALDGSGATLWTSESFYPLLGEVVQCTVADLTWDGTPEVICGAAVVNGLDGSTVTLLQDASFAYYRAPAPADLDRDGAQEIVFGETLFDHEGNIVFSLTPDHTFNFMYTAVINADADPDGEIFGLRAGTGHIYERDGTEIATFLVPGGLYPGQPCVADFDGDGVSEVAVPNSSRIMLFEADGTEVWVAAINDATGGGGCSGFDFDGDGAYEILMSGSDAFHIYDGATGAVLFESREYGGLGVMCSPVVADVDNDGSAEVVVANTQPTRAGITVWGHADNAWPAAGPGWPIADWAYTNIAGDGSVPDAPQTPWTDDGLVRARPAVDRRATPDLYVTIDDVCVADCTFGPLSIGLGVGNQGGAPVAAGASLDVYHDADGTLTWLAGLTLPELPAGERREGVEVTLPSIEMAGARLVARVDGAGAVDECDETNNEAATTVLCP